ncbi:tRNA-modifying protein YgfZ [Thalassotalea mangrovi]|uniref:tRNA-modifying protein YgfZ n=1 Tax=Thalassotalea mangrovi TaxID=2572245 RepID=A0A4V5NXH5_9GAMM|nr:tRNA-modifying protein YgfZ [Thalassotalea mangrovi]TKB46186.1 tRNA-modifying protein YgfZ [Thalassotalea mangrovi]
MNPESSHPALETLPDSFAVWLDDMAMISVSGDERLSYLQGQLTCDINQLPEAKLLHGAHCDAKGKVFSAFRVFEHEDQVLMLMSKDSASASLAQLQKFAVFAKAELVMSPFKMLAVTGGAAESALNKHVGTLPDSDNPVISSNGVSVIAFNGHRSGYILVGDEVSLNYILNALELPCLGGSVWTLLEIVNGFPCLTKNAVEEYVPQMLNLQAIDGISFTKGCYMGQETVARMKYLGKNKRAMFALYGNSEQPIDASSMLEKQLGDNWRRGGNITSLYQADDGSLYIQAVLANDTESNDIFRVKDLNDTVLTQMPLPYVLN